MFRESGIGDQPGFGAWANYLNVDMRDPQSGLRSDPYSRSTALEAGPWPVCSRMRYFAGLTGLTAKTAPVRDGRDPKLSGVVLGVACLPFRLRERTAADAAASSRPGQVDLDVTVIRFVLLLPLVWPIQRHPGFPGYHWTGRAYSTASKTHCGA